MQDAGHAGRISFTFVTDGIEAALEQGRAAAAGKNGAGRMSCSSACGLGYWTSSRSTWPRSGWGGGTRLFGHQIYSVPTWCSTPN
jgi:hypothetical protein